MPVLAGVTVADFAPRCTLSNLMLCMSHVNLQLQSVSVPPFTHFVDCRAAHTSSASTQAQYRFKQEFNRALLVQTEIAHFGKNLYGKIKKKKRVE